MVAQTSDELKDIGAATEETVRVGLLEGRESGVRARALFDGAGASRDQKRFEEVEQLSGGANATLLPLLETPVDRLCEPNCL